MKKGVLFWVDLEGAGTINLPLSYIQKPPLLGGTCLLKINSEYILIN